jgi:hypothetical protein
MVKRFKPVVVRVIAGAAAAQIVKQEMDAERRFAERPPAATESAARRRTGARARAAAALRAVAERLEPAPRGRPGAA